MYRLMTIALHGLWKLGMVASLALGVLAVQKDQTPSSPSPQASEPATNETARLLAENQRLKQLLVDVKPQANPPRAQVHQPDDAPATPYVYEHGHLVPLRSATLTTYQPPQPRPKYKYREPTCTPSRAQIAWARMLPNHDGLANRGLSDEQIVAFFAPSEVKALEGDEVPEHLRPVPDVVYINQRCADGTCTTGYCEASRRNLGCENGVCPVPGR